MSGESRKDSGYRSWEPHMPSMLSVPSTRSIEFILLAKGDIGQFLAGRCHNQICISENLEALRKVVRENVADCINGCNKIGQLIHSSYNMMLTLLLLKSIWQTYDAV